MRRPAVVLVLALTGCGATAAAASVAGLHICGHELDRGLAAVPA